MSNTIAFIPARKGSKSIKNKNLKLINNKSLVELTINQAKKSKLFKKIILSSDSRTIINLGNKKKILTILRPKRISSDKSLTEAALFHAVNYLYLRKINFENIIIMQPTSPLRKLNTLKKFLKICLNKKFTHALTVSKLDHNISVKNKKNIFIPIVNKNIRRRQDRKSFFYENGLIYFLKTKNFLKNKKIYSSKWKYIETELYESLDINNLNDLKIARLLYNKTK